jgi:hypothetical protein
MAYLEELKHRLNLKKNDPETIKAIRFLGVDPDIFYIIWRAEIAEGLLREVDFLQANGLK